MAGVASTIELYDRISAPVNKIIGALNNMVGIFESVDYAMDKGFDPSTIDETRRAINLASVEMNQLGEVIRKNTDNQERFNSKIDDGTSKLMKFVGAYASIQTVKKIAEISDTYVQNTARLGLLVEKEEEVAQLQEQIYASAQRSRGSYQAMTESVAKLGLLAGKAFSGTEEMVAFTELLNKNFVVGGASATEQASAMYQLTQAMASGRLQGDEYRSIIENAPLLAQSIEDYMRNVQGATGTMKEWASEGLLTADVIKIALFQSAEQIEERFANMPMTWSQVWTGVMNTIYKISQPILKMINWMAQNWSILKPIILGVAAATLIYLGAMKGVAIWQAITNGVMTAFKAIQTFVSIGFGVLTGNTAAASAAQFVYNSALMACPLTWILLLIVAVVAALYAVIAVINKVTGKSISATGIVVGVLMTAVAFIWNLFLGLVDLVLGCINYLVNPWIAFANFFGNLFNDPVGAIIHLFGDMADRVLGIVETIAKALDKVLGTDMAGAVQGWRNNLDTWIEGAANKYGNGSYEKVVDELNLSTYSFGAKRWAYGDAYQTGYDWGANLGESAADAFNIDKMLENMNVTTENTEEIKDALDITNEELKYMKDLAERDIINRFTTAEIKVDMTNNNNINSSMDLDGVVEYLVIGVNEAMANAAEGVHV